MAVVAILLVLIGVWLHLRVRRLMEEALRDDLFSLRAIIQEYTYDKKKAPRALNDLVKARYLKSIPADPMTGRADWQTTKEDTMLALDQTQPGIVDVHSVSQAIGSDGTSYNTW